MEPGSGPDSVPPSGPIDKSKVLDVKPLRSLVPVFPSPLGFTSFSAPQVPPFVSAPPFGPHPPGFAPFYPFFMPGEAQTPPEQHPQHAQSGSTNHAGIFGSNPAMQSPPTAVPLFRAPVAPMSTQFTGSAVADGLPLKKSSRNHKDGISVEPQAINKRGPVRSVMEENGLYDGQERKTRHLEKCDMETTDAEAVSNREKHKGKSHEWMKNEQDSKLLFPVEGDRELTGNNRMTFDALRRADGDKESVTYILMTFDALRRRIIQLEEAKEATRGVTRRPDLRSGTYLMNKGIRTNTKKRIGAVPGVEIGDIFFFRMEMCLVGLHAPCMAGIDYTSLKVNHGEEHVAVSIVSSGGYGDDVENGDVLIYSGQGGNINRKDKLVVDQKLERGNLALERSLCWGNDVRVIRGIKDVGNPTGKVYVYDGLYKVHKSWIEKGKSGCNIFKYKLMRVPGQPDAFTRWKSIQQWKDGVTCRNGVILPDLTSGAENLPVCLVNDVDRERGPSHFTYFPGLKCSKSVNLVESSFGCDCQSNCRPGDPKCSCIQKNGGNHPYTALGVLVSRKPMIHECGSLCRCYPNCRNRVSQTGLKVRLEVFKTKDRGWGLRSWDPIHAGAFVCEYAGEVIERNTVQGGNEDDHDEFIFDTSRTYGDSLQWNYMPELLGEETAVNLNETYEYSSPVIISAKNIGNVARFMNHSCCPNVFWQPVLHESCNESSVHVSFYASKHIPPMTELTYDYGIVQSEVSNIAHCQRKKCLCGSSKCRDYFA